VYAKQQHVPPDITWMVLHALLTPTPTVVKKVMPVKLVPSVQKVNVLMLVLAVCRTVPVIVQTPARICNIAADVISPAHPLRFRIVQQQFVGIHNVSPNHVNLDII
jgi:hypothetical protein